MNTQPHNSTKSKESMAKIKLKNYVKLCRDIDNEIERLERMESAMTSIKSGIGDGMPHSTFVSDRISDQVSKKIDLEELLKENIAKEKKELKELTDLVLGLNDPDERQVICLKYFDDLSWTVVCEALYYRNQDYEENLENYQRRVYRVHGSALQNINKMLEQKHDKRSKSE